MQEVIQEAISAYNLPLTIVLGLVAVYWLISLAGVMEFDALDGFLGLDAADGADVDVDVDLDVDVDADVSADADGDGGDHHHGSGGFLQSTVKLLGATDAPIMFVLTVYVLTLWGCNMLGNIYFNKEDSGNLATIILGVSLVGSFLLTRLTIRPLRPLMRLLRDTESRIPLIGMTGQVRSLSVTATSGQVEVVRDGAPILLHARVSEEGEPIVRGTEVLIVMKDEERDAYVVRPLTKSKDL